jgi:hypothetical protein
MKRVFFGACLMFGSFGLTGCDSGGVQEGMPDGADAKPVAGAEDKMKSMADMTKAPKQPTGKDAPKVDAGTPAAPDATKKP